MALFFLDFLGVRLPIFGLRSPLVGVRFGDNFSFSGIVGGIIGIGGRETDDFRGTGDDLLRDLSLEEGEVTVSVLAAI